MEGQTKGEDAAAAADDDDEDAVVEDEDPPTLDANPFAVLVKNPMLMALLKRRKVITTLECFMDLLTLFQDRLFLWNINE
jgi:hypothetical protein